jgi:hypothetical protein
MAMFPCLSLALMAPRLMALLAFLVLKGHPLPVLDQLLSLPALNCLPLLQVTSNRLLGRSNSGPAPPNPQLPPEMSVTDYPARCRYSCGTEADAWRGSLHEDSSVSPGFYPV